MIKRIFGVITAVAIVLSVCAVSASALVDTSVKYGDFNGDGNIDTGDASAVLKAAAGLGKITDAEVFKRCDVNSDGEITVFDARQVLRSCAGLSTLQPEGVFTGFSDTTKNASGINLFSSPEAAISFFNAGLNTVKSTMPGFTRSETADVKQFNIESVTLSGIVMGESASSVAKMIESMIVKESEPEAVQYSLKGDNCDNAMSVETQNYVSKLNADEVWGIRCSNSVTEDEAQFKTVVIEVALPDAELDNISQTAMGDVFNSKILQENTNTVVSNVFGANAGGDATRKTIKNCVLKAEFIVISDSQYELYRYTTSYETETYITNSTVGLNNGLLSANLSGVQYNTVISVIYNGFEW